MDEFNLWSDQVTNAYLNYAATLVSKILKVLAVIIPKKKVVRGMGRIRSLTQEYTHPRSRQDYHLCGLQEPSHRVF